MTFNIRTSVANDGINSFEFRKPHIIGVITQHAPDLIGFQEVTDDMLVFLRDAIREEYEIIACGRNRDYRGECVAIAYKRKKFICISQETFWLSDEPNVPGSTFGGDQSRCPRVTTWARLKPDGYDGTIAFVNTHFDHEGENARLLAAKMMRDLFERINVPFFLTGDFNCYPDSAPIKLLSESLCDLTFGLEGTYHGYAKADFTPTKIDYIFTSIKAPIYTSLVVKYGPFDGVYPSDHYPVLSTVEFE